MSILLPTKTASAIQPEFAATGSNISRSIQNIGGIMTPVFSANLAYARTDYLVDADGRKIGIVNTGQGMGPTPMAGQDYYGNVNISPEKLMEMFAADPKFAAAFQYVSDIEDGLIKADLVARKLI